VKIHIWDGDKIPLSLHFTPFAPYRRESHINMYLVERPVFYTEFSNPLCIRGKTPKFASLNEFDPSQFGYLMDFYCGEMLLALKIDNIEEIKENLKKGCWTFLFDICPIEK
jgi:hypothetical protein